MERQVRESGKPIDQLVWGVPYLPIDPHDVGRSYEAVVRVNSQSGKGGVAYLLKAEHQLDLPRRLQIEFSGVVQAKTDTEGGEVTAAELWDIFQDEYLPATDGGHNDWGRFTPISHSLITEEGGVDRIAATLLDRGQEVTLEGTGNGPIAAFIDALATIGIDVRVLDYAEHALSAGGDAKAAAYVECAVGDRVLWGVGLHSSIVKASLTAVLSAVNRAEREGVTSEDELEISRPGDGP
jgi:2-isopropylmalate synthase